MNIIQFTDSFLPIVDGVGRVVYNYAVTLAQKGHACYVAAPMADTGYRGGYPFELVDFHGASLPGAAQYTAGLPVLDRHYQARMAMLKPDILHAHTPFFAGQDGMRMALSSGAPLVATFHSKYYDDFYKATGREFLANMGVRLIVEFYTHCDEVWAVSKPSADVLRGYGYTGEITVMENGTELRPRRAEDKARAAAFTGIAPGERVLLYVGQMDWKKNLRHILAATAQLNAEGQALRLVLTGQGADSEAIRQTADELGIGACTVFTGHVLDNDLLCGLYQLADLFVFPSVYDTSSLVLREAAAMGTPAVVTRDSCPAEVICDGKNGFLADNTPESLACTIRSALARADLAAVGEAARSSIPVPWPVILDRALARYDALLSRSGPAESQRRRDRLSAYVRRLFATERPDPRAPAPAVPGQHHA